MFGASDFFLFDNDLLPWLLLAVCAAMVVGNLAAVLRPPPIEPGEIDPAQRPSTRRLMTLVFIGAVGAIWAAATLLSH